MRDARRELDRVEIGLELEVFREAREGALEVEAPIVGGIAASRARPAVATLAAPCESMRMSARRIELRASKASPVPHVRRTSPQ